ncbi:MAG: Gfo/Idh/MocA family oxidoreductase, partial [Chloroflexi bacterium]|nr:Gfo/Idh/MocA family oxidoreductase [Chloroflexota bacterium]
MLQIGLIGLGGIASAHLEGLALLEAEGLARCVAGAEPVAERREERRTAFGIPKVYASHRDLLADPDVEAVGILLPHHLHA